MPTNVANIVAGLKEAGDAGAELVVFPETSLHGYPSPVGGQREMLAAVYETAETLDGPNVETIPEAARDLGTHVVFGMTEPGTDPANCSTGRAGRSRRLARWAALAC